MTRIALLLILGLTACSTPNTKTEAADKEVPTEKKISEAAYNPWTVDFQNGCKIQGEASRATLVECKQGYKLTERGTYKLSPELAKKIGAEVAELKAGAAQGCGFGARFSDRAGKIISLEKAAELSLYNQAKKAVEEAYIAQRDRGYLADFCKKPGEVMLEPARCGSPPASEDGTSLSVCINTPPVCGAPIANMKSCGLDGACASGICGFSTGVCEPNKNRWTLTLARGCSASGLGKNPNMLSCPKLGFVKAGAGMTTAQSEALGREISLVKASKNKKIEICYDAATYEDSTQRYKVEDRGLLPLAASIRQIIQTHQKSFAKPKSSFIKKKPVDVLKKAMGGSALGASCKSDLECNSIVCSSGKCMESRGEAFISKY